VTVLGVAHDLGRHRSLAAQGPAELADDATGPGGRASIQVDVLADEGRAPAVGAAMPIGLERTDTAPQENPLELLDMARGGGHRLKDSPSRARFLQIDGVRLRVPEGGYVWATGGDAQDSLAGARLTAGQASTGVVQLSSICQNS